MSHLFSEIKKRRKSLKITQEKLALVIGVSVKTIQRIESGDTSVTFSNLQATCEALGMKITIS
ncbi:helix-turn-helix domain-containing protein [Persicobacter sp. JZB09]|uniref:HTH cro/C1-type domain-containing protein n=1 Tax=Persicobacter diffluens TaxID=981 RepID=A0AAN4W4U0_9BACT|nr:hypothetical protein PEDI_54010 [Persicobacter diffluens]